MRVLKSFYKKGKINYPLLADKDSVMIKAFGILNEQYKRGHKWHGVPYPYIFFADAKGKVLGKLAEKRYQDRPPFPVVLKMVKESMK